MSGSINNNSMAAKLRNLQQKIDDEIEIERCENELAFRCREGCIECCSHCFCVSETEFVQILTYISEKWARDEILQVINKSKKQWEMLKTHYSSIAQMINGNIPLNELFKMNDYSMPFPCVFLSEKGSCSIYKARPLKCRIHGNGYTDLLSESKPCSILPRISSAPDKFVNLTKFRDDIFGFIFLKSPKGVIIRRPLPLFFFFALIFRDITLADCISDIDFYKELTAIEAHAYIDNLVT